MYDPLWKNYYFSKKEIRFQGKWQLLREVGKEQLSPKAQLKLEWIIFYSTVGEESVKNTAFHFGIARKTFYKWLNRFEEKNLRTLEEKSKAPEHTRTRQISFLERDRIKKLR